MSHSPVTIANYALYHSTNSSLIIHKSVPHTLLLVIVLFSVLVAKVSLHSTLTVASLYIPLIYRLFASDISTVYKNPMTRFFYWVILKRIISCGVPMFSNFVVILVRIFSLIQ